MTERITPARRDAHQRRPSRSPPDSPRFAPSDGRLLGRRPRWSPCAAGSFSTDTPVLGSHTCTRGARGRPDAGGTGLAGDGGRGVGGWSALPPVTEDVTPCAPLVTPSRVRRGRARCGSRAPPRNGCVQHFPLATHTPETAEERRRRGLEAVRRLRELRHEMPVLDAISLVRDEADEAPSPSRR
jgi:hypothetical protein